MMAEIWAPIAGFEGLYEVSSEGRVRSLPRLSSGRSKIGNPVVRSLGGRVLAAHPAGKGYLSVCLSKDGNVTQVYVHRCVALAFLGHIPHGMEVCHRDGLKTNNRVSNLRYDTPVGNNADKRLHGTNPEGERNPRALLTESQVKIIRALSGSKAQREIGQAFGVTQACVSDVVRRVTWQHVAG